MYIYYIVCERVCACVCARVTSPVVYITDRTGVVVSLVWLKGGMNQRVVPRPWNGGSIATAGGCF